MARLENESAIEYASRAIGWLEQNADMDDLPTVVSLFELFDLICDVYDVSLIDEVYEAIDDGADAQPLIDFINKYDLDWHKPERSNVPDDTAKEE